MLLKKINFCRDIERLAENQFRRLKKTEKKKKNSKKAAIFLMGNTKRVHSLSKSELHCIHSANGIMG